jgi:DNA-binding beta-propeller fold protein YncE
VWSTAFSRDAAQKYLYVADGENGAIHVLNRESGAEVATIGHKGRYAGQFHDVARIALDSKGNLYVTEITHNMRLQKLIP